MEQRWTLTQARKYLGEQMEGNTSYVLQFLLSERFVETIEEDGVTMIMKRELDEGIALLREHTQLQELLQGDLVTTSGALDIFKDILGHAFKRGRLLRLLESEILVPAYEVPYRTRPYHLYRRDEVKRVALQIKAQEMSEREKLTQFQEDHEEYYTTGEAVSYLSTKFGKTISYDALYHQVHRMEALPKDDPKHVTVYRFRIRDAVTCYYVREDLDKIQMVRGVKRQHRPKDFKPVRIRDNNQLTELEKKFGCRLLPAEDMWEEMCRRAGFSYSYDAFRQRRSRGEIWPVAISGKDGQWFPESQLDNLVFMPQMSKHRREKKDDSEDNAHSLDSLPLLAIS